MTSSDGKRQMSIAVNLQRWNKLAPSGKPRPHPIDNALGVLYQVAMSGNGGESEPARARHNPEDARPAAKSGPHSYIRELADVSSVADADAETAPL